MESRPWRKKNEAPFFMKATEAVANLKVEWALDSCFLNKALEAADMSQRVED